MQLLGLDSLASLQPLFSLLLPFDPLEPPLENLSIVGPAAAAYRTEVAVIQGTVIEAGHTYDVLAWIAILYLARQSKLHPGPLGRRVQTDGAHRIRA